MFSVFMELVKRVGIFVIIGQTILHFGISKKYEKYMKLVISFMVAAQIVFAFGGYLVQDEKMGYFMSGEEYLEKWNIQMLEVEERIEESRAGMVHDFEEKIYVPEYGNITGKGNHTIRVEKIVIQ